MVVALLAALFSWLLLRGLIPQLHCRLLDQPNARSSHHQPTPRGGGVAFVVVASASSGIALITGQVSAVAAIPFLALPIAIVGLLDDRYNLPSHWRYGVQLLTAALVILVSLWLKVYDWLWHLAAVSPACACSDFDRHYRRDQLH